MRPGTTPTHTFQLSFDVPEGANIRIVYAQNRKIVLERTTETLTIEGNTISLKLTVEETLLFDSSNRGSTGPEGTYLVEIQIGIRKENGDQLWSDIATTSVQRVLREDGVI